VGWLSLHDKSGTVVSISDVDDAAFQPASKVGSQIDVDLGCIDLAVARLR
jgi:hypothetical protein